MRNWSAMGVIDDVHLVCEPVHRVHILSIYFRAEIVQRGDVTLLRIGRRDGTKRMCIAQAAWTPFAIQCARIAHGHGYLGSLHGRYFRNPLRKATLKIILK